MTHSIIDSGCHFMCSSTSHLVIHLIDLYRVDDIRLENSYYRRSGVDKFLNRCKSLKETFKDSNSYEDQSSHSVDAAEGNVLKEFSETIDWLKDSPNLSYFLLFICGNENSPALTRAFKSKILEKADNKQRVKEIIEDPYSFIVKDLSIVNKALAYCLDDNGAKGVRYILAATKDLYINAAINFDQLQKLAKELPYSQGLLTTMMESNVLMTK